MLTAGGATLPPAAKRLPPALSEQLRRGGTPTRPFRIMPIKWAAPSILHAQEPTGCSQGFMRPLILATDDQRDPGLRPEAPQQAVHPWASASPSLIPRLVGAAGNHTGVLCGLGVRCALSSVPGAW